MAHVIDVTSYGASPINADNQLNIQNALNAAASLGAYVYFPPQDQASPTPNNGPYKTSSIHIPQGVRGMISEGGVLLSVESNPNSNFIYTEGDLTGSIPVSDFTIEGFTIDINNTVSSAIYLSQGNVRINIKNNKIVNIYEGSFGCNGITVSPLCIDCEIADNYVSLPTPSANANGLVGILVNNFNARYSVTNDNYYDSHRRLYFLNNGENHIIPCAIRTKIGNNLITGGTHGVMLKNAFHSSVEHNKCIDQRDRGIILAGSSYNLIQNNQCLFFGSSGIHMAFSCDNNLISNNYIEATESTGEAGIQGYLGCVNNRVLDNYVECSSNYGVYFGCNVSKNVIEGNSIQGFKIAAIAIEADWNDENNRPSNTIAPYCRQTTAASFTNTYNEVHTSPPSPIPAPSKWSFANSQLNAIINNQIFEGYDANAGGIALTAINGVGGNSLKLNDTIVVENKIYQDAFKHQFHFYEQTSSRITDIVLRNNSTPLVSNSKIFFSSGRSLFSQCENNSLINDGTITIPAGTTIPDVSIGKLFICVNTSSTSISDFVNGMDGQEIIIKLDINTTVINNVSTIRLKGLVNITGADANKLVTFRNIGGIWFELNRNW